MGSSWRCWVSKDCGDLQESAAFQAAAAARASVQERYARWRNKPRFEAEGEINRDATGMLLRMRDKKSNELVCVKFVERSKGADFPVWLTREILNHKQLRHENVIAFRMLFMTDTALAIVTDYASEGTLGDRIAARGRLSEPDARDLFAQLLAAVEYCHERGVYHRDLKLSNVLLAGNVFQPVVKVTNFSYSKSEYIDGPMLTVVGTPAYSPPELLLQSDEQPADYYLGAPVDLWHCGVLLYCMVVGEMPFQNRSPPPPPPINSTEWPPLDKAAMQAITTCTYSIPEHVQLSDECRDLLARFLVADPERRITLQEVMRHPWMRRRRPPPRAKSNRTPASQQPNEAIKDTVKQFFLRAESR